MNKFTLKFKDKELEQLYQTFLLDKILHPVFLVLAFFSIVILAIKNIDGFINDNQSQFTLKIVGFCFIIFLTIVSYFCKKFTRTAFYLVNHFMMLYQINQRTEDAQHTYLFGQNQMLIHAIIMFVSDYPDGMISSFTWTIVRLTIANTVDKTLDYQDQIYCMGVFICLLLCLYIKNVHLRKAYLFSIKDNQWEVLLPSLISKPTFIFTLDEDKQQFQIQRMIQMHFLRDIENPLVHFLRSAKINQKTLEQYIWEKYQQKKNNTMRYSIENLNIYYNKKNKHITFSECMLDTTTYILVIDSEDKSIVEINNKHQNFIQKQDQTILRIFQTQSNIIKKGLKDRNFDIIFDLGISIVQIIQRYKLNDISLKLVNFTKLLDYIIEQFQTVCEYDFKCEQNILILTIQPLLVSYLLYLFQNIRQYNNITVELTRINGQIQLQILGQMYIEMNPFYQQVEQILIKRKILIKPCTILIFNESPMLSFNSKFYKKSI